MSPVTQNRAQLTWLLPDKAGKFMQFSDGQEVWVRAEKLAVSLRSARKAELISNSWSKFRNPHKNVMAPSKQTTDLAETREETAQPDTE